MIVFLIVLVCINLILTGVMFVVLYYNTNDIWANVYKVLSNTDSLNTWGPQLVSSIESVEQTVDQIRDEIICAAVPNKTSSVNSKYTSTTIKVEKKSGKPFKSGNKVNTVKSFKVNPDDPQGRIGFIFYEDDSCVNTELCKFYKGN